MTDREPDDSIPLVDPELESQRKEAAKKAKEFELSHPPIDDLPPIDPLTGERVDLLPNRPRKSAYPGKNPPRPPGTKGAKIDD